MDCMFCIFPNSYVELLMPDVMVVRGGAYGRCLDPEEGGAFMNWVSVLIKEAPESSLSASTMREDGYDPGLEPAPVGCHMGDVIFDLPAP